MQKNVCFMQTSCNTCIKNTDHSNTYVRGRYGALWLPVTLRTNVCESEWMPLPTLCPSSFSDMTLSRAFSLSSFHILSLRLFIQIILLFSFERSATFFSAKDILSLCLTCSRSLRCTCDIVFCSVLLHLVRANTLGSVEPVRWRCSRKITTYCLCVGVGLGNLFHCCPQTV